MAVFPDDLIMTFEVAKRQFLEAGRDDLASWAEMELSGYPKSCRVPTYRTVPAQARGVVETDAGVMDNYLLPVWHLAGDWAHEDLRNPVSQVTQIIERRLEAFRQPIENDSLALFTRGLRLGNGARVTSAWWQIETSSLVLLLERAHDSLNVALQELNASSGVR